EQSGSRIFPRKNDREIKASIAVAGQYAHTTSCARADLGVPRGSGRLVLQNPALPNVLTGRYPKGALESIREVALIRVSQSQTRFHDRLTAVEQFTGLANSNGLQIRMRGKSNLLLKRACEMKRAQTDHPAQLR